MVNGFADSSDETNLYWLVAHAEDVERSECSTGNAFELLTKAAEYLENGEVVPAPLATFIATAFRRTASTMDASELAQWLNLTAKNRRPKVTVNELGCWMFRRRLEYPLESETKALNAASDIFGISKTTATDRWKDWKRLNDGHTKRLEVAIAKKRQT